MDALDRIVDREISAAYERLTPVTAADVEGKNLTHVLADMVKTWPLRDLRLNPDINGSSTDEQYLEDVARGLKLKVARKNLETNTVEFRVLALANLDEYERYNLATQAYNTRHADLGEPAIAFDPVTGDTKATTGYISPAIIPNEHDHVPSEDVSVHPKPKARHTTILHLTYRVVLAGDRFKLEYAVEDMKGKVVYYNTLAGTNLTALIRQSVQELWGNPKIYGMDGPLYEGIPMLIQGRKLAYAKRKPEWVQGSTKNVNLNSLQRIPLTAASNSWEPSPVM